VIVLGSASIKKVFKLKHVEPHTNITM